MLLKVFKIAFGVFALIFTLLHALALVAGIITGVGRAGDFGASAVIGHIVGIALGILFVILCFRKKKGAMVDEYEDTPPSPKVNPGDSGRLSF